MRVQETTNETYQGWTNAQTWAAALTINNDRMIQERFLFLASVSMPKYLTYELENLAKARFEREIKTMATWAFEKPSDFKKINWQEIAEELIAKIEDGALTNKTLKAIHVEIQSWRDKVNGNTYSSYYILVNGEKIYEGVYSLNTADNALYYAREQLVKAFKIEGIDSSFAFREYCENKEIVFTHSTRQVLKREMIRY